MASRLAFQRIARQRATPMVRSRGYADKPASGGGVPVFAIVGVVAIVGGIWYATQPAAPGPTTGQRASQHATNASNAASTALNEVGTAAKEGYNSATARSGQGFEKVQDGFKQGEKKVEGAWTDVKDKTRGVWGSTKDELDHLGSKAEKKGKQAEGEVRGWFSWGQTKAENALDKARDDAIWAQREAAAKAREGADKVKKTASKYE